MNVEAWLGSRRPAPPPVLLARIHALLDGSLQEPAERVPELCLASGERLVADLLQRNDTSRGSALDLLTADALVTYAFEAAGEMASGIDARAGTAMRRISMLATAG